MSMTDPLADLLTRVRNGQQAKLGYIVSPVSKLRTNVLEVLKREGYIRGYEEGKDDKGFKQLRVELKYVNGEPAIKEIKKISKPGRRNYSSVNDLDTVYNGLGISILSTPNGVISDDEARKANVGGEVLCTVF